jgi:hypothetical protein
LRTNYPGTVSGSHILSEARALELKFGAVDGRPFPAESTSELLWDDLKPFPPRLPDGSTVERRRGETEERTMQLLAGFQADARADGIEATQAIDMATVLVGDPRVNAQSLLDWAQSLYGERRSFAEGQFVTFLQEANAFVPVMMRLTLDRKMIISREHRLGINTEWFACGVA